MKLDFSRITCPVSLNVIDECDCQNCILARMEADYEEWREGRKYSLLQTLTFCAFVGLVGAFIFAAATR